MKTVGFLPTVNGKVLSGKPTNKGLAKIKANRIIHKQNSKLLTECVFALKTSVGLIQ